MAQQGPQGVNIHKQQDEGQYRAISQMSYARDTAVLLAARNHTNVFIYSHLMMLRPSGLTLFVLEMWRKYSHNNWKTIELMCVFYSHLVSVWILSDINAG